MKTVTSVSGGKTSCMMALEYPSDFYVFAVVLTDHEPSAPKDKGLARECQNRIPWFVATHEADQTLLNILRLEQEMGKQIKWVASRFSLDAFIEGRTDHPGYRTGAAMLPNSRHRFCTVKQKLEPIFDYCYSMLYQGDPLLMNIGLRWDEPRRVEGWTCENDKFKFAASCKIQSKKYEYQTVEWRVSHFPLYYDKVTRLDVTNYWEQKGWDFPDVSNCRFCFHHRPIQSQLQAVREQDNLQWWIEMEERHGKTFGSRPLSEILQQPILDVFDSSLSPCHCTD